MLTICLISQGRDELSDFLESAEVVSCLEYVNFILVDNGAPVSQSKAMEEWALSHENALYLRRDQNCTDMNVMWDFISEHISEWVVFPGDDDRLLLEGIRHWKVLSESPAKPDVIAMTSRIMRSDGTLTSDVIGASHFEHLDAVSQLALALHNPPFFWPSTFIKSKMLNKPFPISRFVLDWSIGIQLVLTGKILISPISSLEYRRHDTQESNLASSNRKMFEALYWFDDFVTSPAFLVWLSSRENEEIQIFWRTLVKYSPVYGDPNFSNILMYRIGKLILQDRDDPAVRNSVISDLASKTGVLLHDQSVREIFGDTHKNFDWVGNLRIQSPGNDCLYINDLLEDVKGGYNSLLLEIGCNHHEVKSGTFIDCKLLSTLPKRQALDRLVYEICNSLEENGTLAFAISPNERKLLKILRKYKNNVPTFLIRRFRKTR